MSEQELILGLAAALAGWLLRHLGFGANLLGQPTTTALLHAGSSSPVLPSLSTIAEVELRRIIRDELAHLLSSAPQPQTAPPAK